MSYSSTSDYTATTYFDAQGQPLSVHTYFNGSMGQVETWTVEERTADGREGVRRMLHVYAGPVSYLTRSAYDAEGRQVLAWATSYTPSSTRRAATRWTYVCRSPDPTRREEDRDGDGTVDAVTTWTWDPETRVLSERSDSSTMAAEYRFDCAP